MLMKYSSLAQEEEACDDGSQHDVSQRNHVPFLRSFSITLMLVVLLCLSVSANVAMLAHLHKQTSWSEASSPYVGLQRNIPMPLPHDNRTIDDPMWEAPEYDTYIGMVALNDEFTDSKGLLRGQRYPWDHSKGIYFFHGFHSLHCVYVLRQTIIDFRGSKPLAWPMEHVTHCLHVLREDATCYADDMPRYTGTIHENAGLASGSSGTGEIRMCRDWSKLREFAIQHSACYRRPLDHHVPLIDRYKFCPDGSRPWEATDQVSRSS